MPRFQSYTESVFSKFLGREGREIAADGQATIIPVSEFEGIAPIHEDGSIEYDARKPLALFAIEINTKAGHRRWQDACAEQVRMINAR